MGENEAKSAIKHGGLWVQPDGPNTKPEYLGCHDLDDITEAVMGVNLIRCKKPTGDGWEVIGDTITPPDAVTFSINTLIESQADWLESIRCPAAVYGMVRDCGRADQWLSYSRGFGLWPARITQKVVTGVSRREEDVPMTQRFDFSAWPPVYRFFQTEVTRLATTETESLNDIAFCNIEKCYDECGPALDLCTYGVAVGDALAASPTNVADVLYTEDGPAWAATTFDPFAGGEDIISIVCFYVGRETIRWVAARSGVAGVAMEVAYTDDGGDTAWTAVVVGATLAQGANYGGALFALDQYHIWLVTDGGYVYFSEDAAVNWATQDAGIATASDLNAVWAADASHVIAVGDTDAVIMSVDGETWQAGVATGTGDNLLCVNWNGLFWWVGTDGGDLYFADRDADAWDERVFTGSGVGTVTDIQFANALCGFMLSNTAAPEGTVFKTVNGGWDWEALATPANAGLNALWVCDCNTAYAVGEAQGGLAVILRVTGGIPG